MLAALPVVAQSSFDRMFEAVDADQANEVRALLARGIDEASQVLSKAHKRGGGVTGHEVADLVERLQTPPAASCIAARVAFAKV